MTTVTEYARALFSLAEEGGRAEKIGEELSSLVRIIGDNPKYTSLLDTPALTLPLRVALIDEALSPLDEYLLNLVKLLAERRLVHELPALLREYLAALDEARGVLRAEAVSAVPMTEAELLSITKHIETATGKTVALKNTVDPKILGGVVLRYAGIQEDGSLSRRLKMIAESLHKATL